MFVADYQQWLSSRQLPLPPGGVYDTKHLCASLLAAEDASLPPHTSLGPLFESPQERDLAAPLPAAGHCC
jgi:hypothetical protein